MDTIPFHEMSEHIRRDDILLYDGELTDYAAQLVARHAAEPAYEVLVTELCHYLDGYFTMRRPKAELLSQVSLLLAPLSDAWVAEHVPARVRELAGR